MGSPKLLLRAGLLAGLFALVACGSDDDGYAYERGSEVPPPPPSMGAADAGARGASDGGLAGEEPPDDVRPESQPPAVNPFVVVGHDPFSTFAADVDSASYELFHKSVMTYGELPDPRSVRTEEFVNHFRYDYPPVTETSTHPFGIDVALAPVPTSSTTLLRVAITGRDLLEGRERANLVFLVDVSGSMGSDDKLPTVKQMLEHALDALRPDDTVAIVTYSGTVRVALSPTPVRDDGTIRAVLRGLSAGGSTAGGDGLSLAYQQAQAGWVEGGVNHIILCTDGDFNVGPSSTKEILRIVEREREGGTTFTALGFGFGNLNDDMMEAVSNAGNGIYRVITGPRTAAAYAEKRLLSDVVHIAKDVKIQVEINPDFVYAYRQLGYENRQLADDEFRDDRVDAGEIGSGHQMTALYELALTPDAIPTPEGAPEIVDGDPVEGAREILPGELVQVRLRYKRPGALTTDAADEMKAGIDVSAVSELTGETAFAWSVATLASAARQDPFHTPARLSAAASFLDALPPSSSPERLEFVRVFEAARALLER